MSSAMFFIQRCPTCGRRLRVCVEYLGKTIQCRHCRGTLVACDPESALARSDPQWTLMRRVNQWLETPQPAGTMQPH